MLLTAIAVLSYFVNQLSGLGRSLERQSASAANLVTAKDGVLGYVIATDPDGRLPLPDMGLRAPFAHNEGTAINNFTGNLAGSVVIGRLPWKSLGLTALRDEFGECLWYAVAGVWKNTNIGVPTFNWDTLGDFELYTLDGGGNAVLQNDNPHLNRPVAIIFSPGQPLTGQDRSISSVVGETVSECGGNYNAINYLDTANALTALAYRSNHLLSGTAPAGRESDYSSDANHALGTIAAPDKPKSIIATPIQVPDQGVMNRLVNDRILPLTADDIFQRVRALDSFHDTINDDVIQALGPCLQSNNVPGGLAGLVAMASPARKVGKLPAGYTASCPAITPQDKKDAAERWMDNLWYVSCDTDDCLSQGANNCDGALIFAGARTPAQRRSTTSEKANPVQYLEPPALALFQSAASAMPNAAFRNGEFPQCASGFGDSNCTTRLSDSVVMPDPVFDYAMDTALCLHRPPPPPPPPVAPPVDISTLIDVKPANLVARDTATGVITLGNLAVGSALGSELAACTWSQDTVDDSFDNGRRIYFELKIVKRGDGFVFALIDADRNDTTVCGGADSNGQYLAYAGQNTFGAPPTLVTPPIKHPKIGLEFDTERNDQKVSGVPFRNNFRDDNSSSHMAMVYWGYSHDLPAPYDSADPFEDDNIHGYPMPPPTPAQTGYIDPRSPNASFQVPVSSLRNAVGTTHYVRFDVSRTYNAGNNSGQYRSQVWISQTKEVDMDNLSDDFATLTALTPSPVAPKLDELVTIQNVLNGTESFKRVRFGFTVSQSLTGASRRQQIEIKNLTIAPR